MQLIPAAELNAIYVSEKRMLLLRARGEVQKFTSGIAFHPKGQQDGERVFALMGGGDRASSEQEVRNTGANDGPAGKDPLAWGPPLGPLAGSF